MPSPVIPFIPLLLLLLLLLLLWSLLLLLSLLVILLLITLLLLILLLPLRLAIAALMVSEVTGEAEALSLVEMFAEVEVEIEGVVVCLLSVLL